MNAADVTVHGPDGSLIRIADLIDAEFLWVVFFRHLV